MNVQELMIGDLVQVNRDGLCIKNRTIVKVLSLDSESKLEERGLIGYAGCQPLDKEQFSGEIWCEYLSPIPITPEIWKIISDEYKLRVTPWRVAVILIDEDGSYEEEFSIPCPKYIHELQHALQNCGINKEIVL